MNAREARCSSGATPRSSELDIKTIPYDPAALCLLFPQPRRIDVAWPLVLNETAWETIAQQRRAMLARLNHRPPACLPSRRTRRTLGGAR